MFTLILYFNVKPLRLGPFSVYFPDSASSSHQDCLSSPVPPSLSKVIRSDSTSCGLFSAEEDGDNSLSEGEESLRVLSIILPLLTTVLESESESEESLGFLILSALPLGFVLVLEPRKISGKIINNYIYM